MTLLYFWVGAAVIAQSTQLHFKHFTTEDGLPSSETYVSLVDRNGLLWVGTDNGVASFDGYDFTVYDADDGLADAVVFTLQEDVNGRIWAGTISGQVFYLSEGSFKPFAQNDYLIKLRENSSLILLLDVLSSGELILKVNKSGILKINEEGDVKWLTTEKKPTVYVYVPERNQDVLTKQRRYHVDVTLEDDKPYQVVRWNGVGWDFMGETSLPRGGLRPIFPFILDLTSHNRGIVIFGLNKIYQLLPNGQEFVFRHRLQNISSVLPRKGGALLVFMGSGGGIQKIRLNHEELKIEKEVYLDNMSFSAGYKDKRGGVWVNSLDAGIYYLPFPDDVVYTTSNSGEGQKAIAVVGINEKEFYAYYANEILLYRNTASLKAVDVSAMDSTSDGRGAYLEYDKANDLVLTSTVYWKHEDVNSQDLDESDFHPYGYLENGVRKLNSWTKATPCGEDYCWNSPHNFGIFNLKDNYVVTIEKRFTNLGMYRGIESFLIDTEKRLWVGTIYGLKQFIPEYGLVDNNLCIPALSERVVNILEPEPGSLIFATRGNGIVFYKSDTSFQIGVEEGLASNMIRDLHIDEHGVIWAATLEGLSKIEFDSTGVTYSVRTFSQLNGLVSDEVFDVDVEKGNVWLATAKGVVRFQEPEIDSIAASPRITAFNVNGQKMQMIPNLNLKPTQEDISISYVLTDFRLFDEVLYRFRINENEEWQETKERTVNYSNLGPGTYNFSIQSQNLEGKWSNSSTFNFNIASSWYQTWWAWILGGLLFTSLISFIFLRRERIRLREQDLLLQINKLEHEALHAQMNPHFVFNALNSIQNFVLHNDAKQAATYLSRFALVIRQTLRSSVTGEHSLKEEVEMLETYLLLEKLRFKEGFNYSISVDPSLDQYKIRVPPLMIQPFVENAIIHGLNMQETGGQISVSFNGSHRALEVNIEDNGIGYDISGPVDEESYGMEITRKRLAAMKNKKHKVSHMQVKPLYAEDGALRGTKVSLLIYLEQD